MSCSYIPFIITSKKVNDPILAYTDPRENCLTGNVRIIGTCKIYIDTRNFFLSVHPLENYQLQVGVGENGGSINVYVPESSEIITRDFRLQ